ncbi:hypothetical protein VTO42DRAFT_6882 [Malbranchea cinnamomea]
MSNIGNAARVAQAVGITASAFAAGSIFTFSLAMIPALLLPSTNSPKRTFDSQEQPGTPISHVCTQWRHAYNVGKATMPFISLVAGAAYTYAAHSFRKLPARDVTTSNMYLIAAALSIGIIPYTLVVMQPTNKRLMGRAEQADVEGPTAREKVDIRASKEDTVVINWLKTWRTLNFVRALLPFSASLLGVSATLHSIE